MSSSMRVDYVLHLDNKLIRIRNPDSLLIAKRMVLRIKTNKSVVPKDQLHGKFLVYFPQIKVFAATDENDWYLLDLETLLPNPYKYFDIKVLKEIAAEGDELLKKYEKTDVIEFEELEEVEKDEKGWLRAINVLEEDILYFSVNGDVAKVEEPDYLDFGDYQEEYLLRREELSHLIPSLLPPPNNWVKGVQAPFATPVHLYPIISALSEIRNERGKIKITEFMEKNFDKFIVDVEEIRPILEDFDDDEEVGTKAAELFSIYVSVLYHLASTLDLPISKLCEYTFDLCLEMINRVKTISEELNEKEINFAIIMAIAYALTSWYVMPLVIDNYVVKKVYLRNAFYPIEMIVGEDGIEEFRTNAIFERIFKERVFLNDLSLLDILNGQLGRSFIDDVERVMTSRLLFLIMKNMKVKRRDGLVILDAEVEFGLERFRKIIEKHVPDIEESIVAVLGAKYYKFKDLIKKYIDREISEYVEVIEEKLREIEEADERCLLKEENLAYFSLAAQLLPLKVLVWLKEDRRLPFERQITLETYVRKRVGGVSLLCFDMPLSEVNLKELRRKGLTDVMRTTGET